MEYFRIIRAPLESFGITDAEALQEIRQNCGGFVTEIDAGHKGKRLFGIWINADRSEAQQLLTIGHELCHIDRLHLDRLTRSEAEAEAREQAQAYAERYTKGEFNAWEIS